MRNTNLFAVCSLIAVLMLLAAPGNVMAQFVRTGSLDGDVRDPSDSPAPKAKVTLTSLETGAFLATTSDAWGAYLFRYVPVGEHRLEVEQTGFKKYIRTVTVEPEFPF
jgi:hypothetical protein